MKRFWACLAAVLALSACTGVEHFGAYWDKGFVDPALEGSWRKLGLPGRDPDAVPGPEQWRFTPNGSSYSLQGINPVDQAADPAVIERRQADNEGRMSARTLRVGNSLLLMRREPGGQGPGTIERYAVQREVLQEYSMDNGAVLDFLEARHPAARNIRRNVGEGEYVVIDTFDDEVFQVLAEIADQPAYWILTCEYWRIP